MVHYFFNILLWIMLANIWGFSVMMQGHHIYNHRCNTSMAERSIHKRENVFTEPHSSGVYSPWSTQIMQEPRCERSHEAGLLNPGKGTL